MGAPRRGEGTGVWKSRDDVKLQLETSQASVISANMVPVITIGLHDPVWLGETGNPRSRLEVAPCS